MKIEWPEKINGISSDTLSRTEIWFLRESLLSPYTTKTVTSKSKFGINEVHIDIDTEQYDIKVFSMSPYTIFSIEKVIT